MASPFEIFRKNQRLLMAASVLIAILSFIVAPALQNLSGGKDGQTGPDPTLASWNGGSIRKSQYERESVVIQMANHFLRELAISVIAKGGMPAVPGFDPNGALGISSDLSPGGIVERQVLLTEATRLGIQFDDSAVKTFLKRFVDGKMSGKEVEAFLEKSTDRRLPMVIFTRFLKEELAFQEVRRLTSSGLAYIDVRDSRTVGYPILTTPSRNWQEYRRINQQAKIKAFPVNVKDYLDKVEGKPFDKDLKALYEAGRSLVRTDDTLESIPAFMKPATAEIEFVSIDIEKLIQAEMAKISEDAILAEYNTRVEANQFRVPIQPPVAPELPTAPKDPAADTPSSPTSGQPEPANPAPAETAEQTDAPKASDAPAPKAEAQPEAPAEEAPKTETPATDAPATDAPAAPSAPENPQSRVSGFDRSGIRLVSFQEEKPPTLEAPTEAPASEPAKPAEAQDASTEPPANTNTAPSDEPTPNAESGLNLGAPVPQLPPPPEMRTQSLEEVKDQIKHDLALPIALKIADERLNDVYGAMRIYQSERSSFLNASTQPGAEKPSEPEKIDLQKLAKVHDLVYGTTGLVDSKTILLQPIGNAQVSLAPNSQPISVNVLVSGVSSYGEAFYPYQAETSSLGERTRYLFWKTKAIEPVSPSFDECKDQVQEVWKAQAAQKLAESKAKDLASKIGSGQLEDVLVSEEDKKLVLAPPPFTAINPLYMMFMRFNMGGQEEVGRVETLQPVDMGFMEAVFGTKPGDSIVAPDRRRSVFYVIQLLETLPPEKEMLERFQSSPKESVAGFVERENNLIIQSFRNSIFERLGFRQ